MRRHRLVGEHAHQVAVAVAALAMVVAHPVREHQVGRILDAELLLQRVAAAETDAAARQHAAAADVVVLVDHDHRGAEIERRDGGGQARDAGADDDHVGGVVPAQAGRALRRGFAGGRAGDRRRPPWSETNACWCPPAMRGRAILLAHANLPDVIVLVATILTPRPERFQDGCYGTTQPIVMAGLVPAIHVLLRAKKDVDARPKLALGPAEGRTRVAGMTALLTMAAITVAQAQHTCDEIGDEGWRVLATVETTGVKDSAPYAAGGDWFVDRVTTLLPLCNYFTATGEYSLRSYSLDPVEQKERVAICRGGKAVAPYTGTCPPQD